MRSFRTKQPFLAFLDCCHSEGMTWAGGAKVRGLNPPDDIRHRMLKWNRERELWEPRKLAQERELPRYLEDTNAYTGKSGASNRILRGVPLRALASDKKTRDIRETEHGHKGPYSRSFLKHAGRTNTRTSTATALRRMARSHTLLLKHCLTSGTNALARPGDESSRYRLGDQRR